MSNPLACEHDICNRSRSFPSIPASITYVYPSIPRWYILMRTTHHMISIPITTYFKTRIYSTSVEQLRISACRFNIRDRKLELYSIEAFRLRHSWTSRVNFDFTLARSNSRLRQHNLWVGHQSSNYVYHVSHCIQEPQNMSWASWSCLEALRDTFARGI